MRGAAVAWRRCSWSGYFDKASSPISVISRVVTKDGAATHDDRADPPPTPFRCRSFGSNSPTGWQRR